MSALPECKCRFFAFESFFGIVWDSNSDSEICDQLSSHHWNHIYRANGLYIACFWPYRTETESGEVLTLHPRILLFETPP